jgi:hypothetical protein
LRIGRSRRDRSQRRRVVHTLLEVRD